jgi:3-hydroxyisobutyrate dehydrogenase
MVLAPKRYFSFRRISGLEICSSSQWSSGVLASEQRKAGIGLGAALGLDLTMLREVFAQTGANPRVLETDGEDMQNREHSCFFSALHAAKDSGIALELARSLGLDLPLARATKEQYDRMIAEGLGDLDKSGIAELTFKDRHKHSGDRV